MSNIPKWFHIVMSVLFAILAICKAMLTCIEHQWGVIPGVLSSSGIFYLECFMASSGSASGLQRKSQTSMPRLIVRILFQR